MRLPLLLVSLGLSAFLRTGHELTAPPRYGVVLAALIFIGVWMRASVKLVGRLDELHRRIFLEAGAMTWLGILAAAMLYPILEKAGILGRLTHDHVQMFVLPLSVVSFIIAERRYR